MGMRYDGDFWVQCAGCNASSQVHESEEESRKAWNTRAPHSERALEVGEPVACRYMHVNGSTALVHNNVRSYNEIPEYSREWEISSKAHGEALLSRKVNAIARNYPPTDPSRTVIVEMLCRQAQRESVARATSFQSLVRPWLLSCFGQAIASDHQERNHRFLEEALELVQACGATSGEAHQLVDYVYGRDVGEPSQEVGGVMVTLAALCLAQGMDMHVAGDTELARIWTKVELIRAKQAAKPSMSPLPGVYPDRTSNRCLVCSSTDTHGGLPCPTIAVTAEPNNGSSGASS
jgi:hypothetical protein